VGGADERNRTVDLRITNALLYQLSYIGLVQRCGSNIPEAPLQNSAKFSITKPHETRLLACLTGHTVTIAPMTPQRTTDLDLPQTRRVFTCLTLALALFICWQSFVSSGAGLGLHHSDKLLHFAAFAVLTITTQLGRSGTAALDWRLCLVLLVFGGFIELVQSVIPARDASWLDWLADALGIGAGRACGGATRALLKKIF
jgi:hypothetical protein